MPNGCKNLGEHHMSIGSDKKTIDELLSKHHRWITWCEEYGNDNVHVIPEEFCGWSAKAIAVRIAIEKKTQQMYI